MRWRVREVLLVSSSYDSFLFDEDGQLYEQIQNEYLGMSIGHSPEIQKVSRASEALELLRRGRRFDLIITTPHIEDSHPLKFAREVVSIAPENRISLLAFDNRELVNLLALPEIRIFDRIFIWQGDFRLIVAIFKDLEDRMNVEQDVALVGVQVILLIEDNMRFYSSLLPHIYTEILEQSKRLIPEGQNISQRYLRMRARPKILLCDDYETAWHHFSRFSEEILGVISDVDFRRGGKSDPEAGLDFTLKVKEAFPDIPVVLQSYRPELEARANALGASFVLKDSPLFLESMKRFIHSSFSFGDFIFKTGDGREVGRASDLRTFEEQLRVVPAASLRYHGERNHFSNWLKARTEFWLADQLRPRRVNEYDSLESLRAFLVDRLRDYRRIQSRGAVTDFDRESFDPAGTFARIGGGSIGGKARGMAFLNHLLFNHGLEGKYPGVRLSVPSTVVLGTDLFDQFLDRNGLLPFALGGGDDLEIMRRFVRAAEFPEEAVRHLRQFLQIVRTPIAVRSSSLLEDSQYQPFAGVYETYMLPNNQADPEARLAELLTAVKRVYASTYFSRAKAYMKATSYRPEEEKMAVAIQRIVGSRRGSRFYPALAGVARSHNFYPIPPQESAEGVVSMALGLGKMVVEGGPSVKYSPAHPGFLPQLLTIRDTIGQIQHKFFALDLGRGASDLSSTADLNVMSYDIAEAEHDGSLAHVGSTWSRENDAIYEGIARPGVRIVTFSSLLRRDDFPIARVLGNVLTLGSAAMGTAVEIEFAGDLTPDEQGSRQIGLLQMRPLVVVEEPELPDESTLGEGRVLCRSSSVLGSGRFDTISDIVYVDIDTFDRSRSPEAASELGRLNAKLLGEARSYLLVGPGRWGTLDPWLGIPARWDQIAGARVIVECALRDVHVEPSQGSHFFQNLTSFMVGYISVGEGNGDFDWEWLRSQRHAERLKHAAHVVLDRPLDIIINRPLRKGIILKDAAS